MPDVTPSAKPVEKVEEVKRIPTVLEVFNNLKLNGILLSQGIPLGDALERLASGLSRTGTVFDDMGNVKTKGVNKSMGDYILDFLRKPAPQKLEWVAGTYGWDPHAPMFVKGEALDIPVSGNFFMLLPKDVKAQPVFPETDSEQNPSTIKGGPIVTE